MSLCTYDIIREYSSCSGCNQVSAAEADTIREQQLKQTQSGSSSWSQWSK